MRKLLSLARRHGQYRPCPWSVAENRLYAYLVRLDKVIAQDRVRLNLGEGTTRKRGGDRRTIEL
jgi:hypothetical protein